MVILPYEMETMQVVSADCRCHISSAGGGWEFNCTKVVANAQEVICCHGDQAICEGNSQW